MSTRAHAAYGARQVPYFFKRYVLFRNVQPEILFEREKGEGELEKEAIRKDSERRVAMGGKEEV